MPRDALTLEVTIRRCGTRGGSALSHCWVSLPRLACAQGGGEAGPRGRGPLRGPASVFQEQSSLSRFMRSHLSFTAGHLGAGGLSGEQTTLGPGHTSLVPSSGRVSITATRGPRRALPLSASALSAPALLSAVVTGGGVLKGPSDTPRPCRAEGGAHGAIVGRAHPGHCTVAAQNRRWLHSDSLCPEPCLVRLSIRGW